MIDDGSEGLSPIRMGLGVQPHMPDRFIPGIKRYMEHGILPGSFMRAVLTNNLFNALSSADQVFIIELQGIVSWLYNEMPSICWGSTKAVDEWVISKSSTSENS